MTPLAASIGLLALELGLAFGASCTSREAPTALAIDPATVRAEAIAERVRAPAFARGFERAPSGKLTAIGPTGPGYSATVELPAGATGAARITDDRSGTTVEIALEGARDVQAELAGGFVTHPRALPGGELVRRVERAGFEDYVLYDAKPTEERIRYRLELSGKSALRLVGGTLEVLDAAGVPRLRVPPPTIADARGALHPAPLSVEGCAVDRDPRAPWSRPLTPPGAARCSVVLDWAGAGVTYPAVLDPTWATTGTLISPRQLHTATKLGVGQALIVGGFDTGGNAVGTAELYAEPPAGVPSVGVFTPAGNSKVPRGEHTATKLSSGKILFTGGSDALSGGTLLDFAEVYDPQTSSFSVIVTPMVAPRASHAATLLASGKVLITGGTVAVDPTLWSELYDPTTNAFAKTVGAMSIHRSSHVATLLGGPGPLSGQVLVTGGLQGVNTVNTAERYVPATGMFAATQSPMLASRAGHTATPLQDGSVLVAGGGDLIAAIAAAELYQPATDSFVMTAPMPVPRFFHEATLLLSGQVLITGGQNLGEAPDGGAFDAGLTLLGSTLLFANGAYADGPPMLAPREHHTATLLENHVLVAGGVNNQTTLGEAEVLGLKCSKDAECGTGHCASADSICCDVDCNDLCMSCSALGKEGGGVDGTCGPAKAGSSAAICSVDVAVTIECDGKGGVHTPVIAPCPNNFGCLDKYACATSCSPAVLCSHTYFCLSDGTCAPKIQDGIACDSDLQCVSGFCADKVCCDKACEGQCEACDLPKQAGTCVPTTGAPRGARPACSGSPGGECGLECDGTVVAACALPIGKACGSTTCAGATLTPEHCDGKGTCVNGAGEACKDHLQCEGASGCKKLCVENADCVAGFACSAGGTCASVAGAVCDGKHTLKLLSGASQDCAPYLCGGPSCRSTCNDVRDCVAPAVCDGDQHCVPRPEDAGSASSCVTAGRAPRSFHGLVWLSSAVAAMLVRRRRRRRP